jgi:hypothetical protein
MDIVARTYQARLKYQKQGSKCFFFSNALLLLFIFIWGIFGLEFTLGAPNISFEWIYGSLGVFVCVFFLITCWSSIFGMTMSTMDSTGFIRPGVYGFLIFFLVMIPMLTQGSIFGELASFSNEDMTNFCTPEHVFHDELTDISSKVEWL